MIEEMEGSMGPVKGFSFIGEVTDEDYTGVFLPTLRQAIDEYGAIRLVIDIADVQSEGVGAMDDDLRADERLVMIEREAIIGDESWETRLRMVDHLFLFPAADVRFFPRSRRHEAWRWVRERMPLRDWQE